MFTAQMKYGSLAVSEWYGDNVRYLLREDEGISHLGRSQRRRVKRKAFNYGLSGRNRVRMEYSGEPAKHILPDQVDSILRNAHNEYGYWAHAITLHRLIKQFY